MRLKGIVYIWLCVCSIDNGLNKRKKIKKQNRQRNITVCIDEIC